MLKNNSNKFEYRQYNFSVLRYLNNNLGLLLSFLSSCVVIVMIFCPTYTPYEYLLLLPLSFAFGSLFLGMLIKKCNFVNSIVLTGYFVKMVVTPALFSLGGYYSFYNSENIKHYILPAILYMAYEFLIITFLCILYLYIKQQTTYITPIRHKNYKNLRFNITILLICGIMVSSLVFVPEIIQIHEFLFTVKLEDLAKIYWDNETIVSRGSGKRYLYSLFLFFWPIIRNLLPAYFILIINQKFGDSSLGLLFSALCLLIPSIFLGGDNIGPLIGAIFGLIIIKRLYGVKANILVYLLAIATMILIFFIFITKVNILGAWLGGENMISIIANSLNAYFQSFDSISSAMGVESGNKAMTFFYDIYSCIPFRETLFGLHGLALSDLYTSYIGISGQIVPFSSNIAFYSTYLLSPLIIVLLIIFALRCETISQTTDNFWIFYLSMYFAVSTAMAISIYSFVIYIRSLINIYLPMLFIIYISGLNKCATQRAKLHRHIN